MCVNKFAFLHLKEAFIHYEYYFITSHKVRKVLARPLFKWYDKFQMLTKWRRLIVSNIETNTNPNSCCVNKGLVDFLCNSTLIWFSEVYKTFKHMHLFGLFDVASVKNTHFADQDCTLALLLIKLVNFHCLAYKIV